MYLMGFVFGTGGCAKEVEWLLDDYNKNNTPYINLQAFISPEKSITSYIGYQVIEESIFFEEINFEERIFIFLAIANCNIRRRIFEKINSGLVQKTQIDFPTIFHSSINLDMRKNRFHVGRGTLISANVNIMPDVSIGNFGYLSIGAIIGHDTIINDFVTIFPGARIAGHVKIGSEVLIGTGVVIIENVNICNNVIIGAGAIVLKDINEPGTYVGIPAKRIK